MSRFAKIFFALLAVGAIFGLVLRAQEVIRKDPLSRFMIPPSSIGIQLKDVFVRHYTKSALTGTAHIDAVDVQQDHQNMDFSGVHNGVFQTPKGPITFSGKSATYNAVTGQLNVTAGGHVTGKNPNDLNVTAPAFLYDQNTQVLSVPGTVTGTLVGGKAYAINLVYHGTTGDLSVTRIDWVGLPSDVDIDAIQVPGKQPPAQIDKGRVPPVAPTGLMNKQTPDVNGRTKWHISGGLEVDNGKDYYTDMRADDGDILVKAPHGERDEKTDVLSLTGPVYYFSEKANLVCDKAVIYRKEKRAVLTGNVHMLVKPKDQEKLDVSEIPPWKPPVPAAVADSRPAAPQTPEDQQEKDLDDELTSSKTARKYPAHIRSDQIEYWYAKGSRHAIITGSPQCYQEFPGNRWRRIATHEAFYDGEKDELDLKSADGQHDTRLIDSIGDDLVAKEFTVSTKDDDPDRYAGTDVDGVYATDNEDLKDIKNGGQGSDTSKGNGAPGTGGAPVPGGPAPGTPRSGGTPSNPPANQNTPNGPAPTTPQNPTTSPQTTPKPTPTPTTPPSTPPGPGH